MHFIVVSSLQGNSDHEAAFSEKMAPPQEEAYSRSYRDSAILGLLQAAEVCGGLFALPSQQVSLAFL